MAAMATVGDSVDEVLNGLSTQGSFLVASYTILFLTLAATIIWLLSGSSQSKGGRLPLPPGSLGLPLIGETLQFGIASQTAVGYREWMKEKATKYGPLFKTHLMGSPVVIMDPPAGNKLLFQNEGKLVENHWPGSVVKLLGSESLTMKYGEEHKIARRYWGGFFDHAAVLRYLEDVDRRSVQHFAIHWEGKDELLALDATQMFTFSTICGLLMSLDEGPEMEDLQVNFRKWAYGILKLPIYIPGFAYYGGMQGRKFILKFLDRIITRRRQELAEDRASEGAKIDALTSLLTIPNETGVFSSDAETKDNLLLLLFAGHDTSSVALAFAMYFIAENPHVYEQLVQEHKSIVERKREKGESDVLTPEDVSAMKYSWKVLQESLRLQPPVAATFRRAITDFDYNGYSIPKGWKLMWSNQQSHYNPKFFKEPMRFDPSRWEQPPMPYTFIPFGGGPRICPGYEFAKMEMLIFLHHLIRRYQWTLVDPDEPIIRNPMPGTPKRLPIRITKISSF